MQINAKACFIFLPVMLSLFCRELKAQERYPVSLSKANWHNEERKLRYQPQGGDFVIKNGERRFNRALYGTHTSFRVEAGDLPEFAFYMPGMGGNLKFGLQQGTKTIWLIHAKQIIAKYRPGSMHYEVEDPILGTGKLHLEVLALADAEGLVVKTWVTGKTDNVDLICVFGGASGKKFSRSGDMGPDPESSFYLKPEYCTTNTYTLNGQGFDLQYGAKTRAALTGFFPGIIKLADANQLADPLTLYHSKAGTSPVVTAKKKLTAGENQYVVIKNPEGQIAKTSYNTANSIFIAAENSRKKIADRIQVNTPDPYINTIGGAISMASDAIWEKPSYLHGAVGWRSRLNGWRGPYTADPLGWHDRARTHFEAYAKSQLNSPLTGPVIADTAFHLARHQEKLGTSMFTAGYISRDPDGNKLRPHHYDMNLVYIDALLWHLNWTGDLLFVKKMWPILQKHLAWEKRNFDPDGDGLYDAYAAIWASDALYYSGGAVTHSSAYNYRANKMAAQIANLLGENASPYEKEAALIKKAINTELWMPEKGVYAEFKDGLGLKNLHPSAALWTIYHSLDSEIADPFQAYQSLQYVDHQIPHIPIRARGLPANQYATLSTTSWMPYTWSINNVAMAESMHTALANWEAGRKEEAFNLFKSELLAGMYMGGSPGNFVQISHYDAARGEAYRDFGDPVGISSRTLVEGLFGIVPDALNKMLKIRPGLPEHWDHAEIRIPDLDFKFKRKGQIDTYDFVLDFQLPLALQLQVNGRGRGIRSVTVNGQKTTWKNDSSAVGTPLVEINVKPAKKYAVIIQWEGDKFVEPKIAPVYAIGDQLSVDFGTAKILEVKDPQATLKNTSHQQGKLNGKLVAANGNYSVFVQLQSGSYIWWYPLSFKLMPPVSLNALPEQQKNALQFSLVNHRDKDLKGILTLGQPGNLFKRNIKIAAKDTSANILLQDASLVPGTNVVLLTLDNGERLELKITNWAIYPAPVKQRSLELADLFNEKVTQIFKQKYLTPRPVGPTLQLPWQGIGDWPHALEDAEIDDTGLRLLAGKKHEIAIPQGIKFNTPSDITQKNIVFTSQWDNYPTEKLIPLSGQADHAYFLMTGSTNHMQSQFDNGKITILYTDGTTDELVLRNPESWWPIEEDYYTDGFAFQIKRPRPVTIALKTGLVIPISERQSGPEKMKIDGGAARVYDLPLDGRKTLKSLTLQTLANDVVIGLMSVTFTQQSIVQNR